MTDYQPLIVRSETDLRIIQEGDVFINQVVLSKEHLEYLLEASEKHPGQSFLRIETKFLRPVVSSMDIQITNTFEKDKS